MTTVIARPKIVTRTRYDFYTFLQCKPQAHAFPAAASVSSFGQSSRIISCCSAKFARARKEEGVDAIQKMCKVINALKEMDEEKKWTYKPDPEMPKCPMMSVGSIIGGRGESYELRGANELADHCTILVDIRHNRHQSVDSVKKDVERSLNQLEKEDRDFKYSIKLPPLPFGGAKHPHPPSPFELIDDEWIIKTVRKYHEQVWGSPIPSVTSYAASDTAIFAIAGVPAFGYYLCELLRRPTDGVPGVRVNEMVKGAKTLILAALDMCTKTKEEYDRLRILVPK